MNTVILNQAKVNSVQKILKATFGLVPIITGIDKFSELLVDWDKYIAPLAEFIPFAPHTFMLVVGAIEIVAGIIVLRRPRIGAYIVATWLVCIAFVLIWGGYLDIAARDLVLAISAFCLGELYDKKQNGIPEKEII